MFMLVDDVVPLATIGGDILGVGYNGVAARLIVTFSTEIKVTSTMLLPSLSVCFYGE